MKKILFLLLLCLTGMAYGQTIGYLRYDTVKIFTTKTGGRGSLDVTGNVRFTGLLPKSAGTDSVVVRDVNGNLGTVAKSALGGVYTASNGLTMTSNNVKLGGSLIEATQIYSDGYTFEIVGNSGIGGIGLNSAASGLTQIGDINSNYNSLFFSTDIANDRAYLTTNGSGSPRLGVGTATPSATLHINGISQFGTAGSELGQLKVSGNTSGTVSIQPAAAAGTWTMTLPTNDGDNGDVLTTNGSGVTSWAAGGGGGVTTMTAVGASPNANGATISGVNLTLQPASSAEPGVVIAGTQSFGGVKSFLAFNPGGATMDIQNVSNTGYSGIQFIDDASAVGVFMGYNNGSPGEFRFNNIHASGHIDFKIGGTNGLVINNNRSLTAAFYGAGTATFDASGNITSVSDERLKKIQGPSKAGLREVCNLVPINYKWNEKSGNERLHTYTGFSAQNVKANIPNGIGVMPDGYLTLQDRAIMAAMVNAIKELKELNDKQQKEIELLKRKIK